MIQAQQAKRLQPFDDRAKVLANVLAMVRRHIAARPPVAHALAWTAVGVWLGILIAPAHDPKTVLAFVIAGCLVSFVLAVLAYPVSISHRHTLAGAIIGLGVSAVAASWPVSSDFPLELGLVIGSLIGGTALVWLRPLTWLLFERSRPSGVS